MVLRNRGALSDRRRSKGDILHTAHAAPKVTAVLRLRNLFTRRTALAGRVSSRAEFTIGAGQIDLSPNGCAESIWAADCSSAARRRRKRRRKLCEQRLHCVAPVALFARRPSNARAHDTRREWKVACARGATWHANDRRARASSSGPAPPTWPIDL